MDTNLSTGLLTLESLELSDVYIYPAFVFGTLLYLWVLFCNLLILMTIICCKKMHKPMFMLMCNLPISDILGATGFYPHFVFSIVTQNRQISYPACVTQAFTIHFYGSANLLILSAMAYDRYIAVCYPLRYNSIMSTCNLIRIIISVWFLSFLIIFVLILLLVQLTLCRTKIVDLFCNNPSLLKLTCQDTSVNNIYGLVMLFVLQGIPMMIMLYTYGKILHTCVATSEASTRQKAFQTCSSHIIAYVILQVNTFVTLLAHRIDIVKPLVRRGLGLSVIFLPPLLDPIIYGLKTKELKDRLTIILKLIGSSSKM
ncbi:olfactory receptor 52Z1P-like [Antennarius striatus]|uniref:olfactory receptor 52Z1P-like n=1 Tax=Antennarius striatus TaxID=241820 RepID=UPI0035AF88D6